MKIRSALILALALAALTLMAACSDKTSNSRLNEGDYNDEDFVLAREDADSALDEMRVDDRETGDWLVWRRGDDGWPDIDSVIYDSTSGWHYRQRQFNNDYIEISVADSFRFFDTNMNYQFRRDSTTNVFERRLKKYFELTPQPESLSTYWVRNRERNMLWEGLADSVTTLNGDFHRLWDGESRARSFSKLVEGDLTDISFYTADLEDDRPAYPFDGEFVSSMTLDIETPRRQAHIEGELTVTFYRDGDNFCYHARLERGDNWWEWDRCFPQ
jgi:hypothetical protein